MKAGDILQSGPYGVREKAARDAALRELASMNRVRLKTCDRKKIVVVNPDLLRAGKFSMFSSLSRGAARERTMVPHKSTKGEQER